MYGRSSLFSNLITKARERVKGFYSLENSKPEKAREDVEWLLIDSRFMYGGVDLAVCLLSLFNSFTNININRKRSMIVNNPLAPH